MKIEEKIAGRMNALIQAKKSLGEKPSDQMFISRIITALESCDIILKITLKELVEYIEKTR